MGSNKEETVKVRCMACGDGYRIHKVLHHFRTDYEEDYPEYKVHQMIQCAGCETVRYRRYDILVDSWDEHANEYIPTNVKIFPDDGSGKNKRPYMDAEPDNDPFSENSIPATVWGIYRETVDAFNAGANTLSGAGLRATVEAICNERGIAGDNLKEQIDKLANKGLLTTSQAELLHEERYLGNAAIHEMAKPSATDLHDGLGIVEGLMSTIYLLPQKAERLKQSREKRERDKNAGKGRKRPTT